MTDKPPFDPNQPFDAVDDKPAFDPSKPFQAVSQGDQHPSTRVYIGPTPSSGDSLGGIAKSLGVGLGQGAIGLAGLPGDAANLLAKGSNAASNYIAGKMGFDQGPQVDAPLLPTSDSIQKGIEGVTGDFYKPQGPLEETAAKIGQFAPAIIGGPESLAAKLATRAVTPAFASEAAGQATKGTAAQPYAELGGALLGGAGASAAARKFQEMAAARTAAKAMPTGANLLQTGSNQFDQARDMNLVVKPDFVDNAVSDMRSAIKGYDPEAQKPVFAAVDRLENLSKSTPGLPPPAVEMNEVENIRKQLSKLRMSQDAPTRDAAKEALKSLTSSQMALAPADVIAGDAGAYSGLMRNAVGNYGAGKRSATIEGKMNLAELNASSPVGLLDNASKGQALQRTMKQLARPINNTNVPVARKLGFNNDEVSAITHAALGNKWTHAGELIDRLTPAKLGAIPGAIAAQIGGLSIKKQVSTLESLTRSRAPLAAQVAAQLPPTIIRQLSPKTQAILTAMVAAPHAIQQITQQPSQTAAQ